MSLTFLLEQSRDDDCDPVILVLSCPNAGWLSSPSQGCQVIFVRFGQSRFQIWPIWPLRKNEGLGCLKQRNFDVLCHFYYQVLRPIEKIPKKYNFLVRKNLKFWRPFFWKGQIWPIWPPIFKFGHKPLDLATFSGLASDLATWPLSKSLGHQGLNLANLAQFGQGFGHLATLLD